MLSTQNYLLLCENLQRELGAVRLTVGKRVARGFADLGYEEYCVIGSDQIVSLFNGQRSKVPEGHLVYFFNVFEIEDLLDLIAHRKGIIKEVEFKDHRNWRIVMQNAGRESCEVVDRQLNVALARGIQFLMGVKFEN